MSISTEGQTGKVGYIPPTYVKNYNPNYKWYNIPLWGSMFAADKTLDLLNGQKVTKNGETYIIRQGTPPTNAVSTSKTTDAGAPVFNMDSMHLPQISLGGGMGNGVLYAIIAVVGLLLITKR